MFVGATRGIGEATLKQFVRHAVAPRVYFVGRDRANGERVGAELANLNPEGEYHFRIADVSLLANVDEVCREIKCKERVINLLFMSCGTTIMGIGTFFFFFSWHISRGGRWERGCLGKGNGEESKRWSLTLEFRSYAALHFFLIILFPILTPSCPHPPMPQYSTNHTHD